MPLKRNSGVMPSAPSSRRRSGRMQASAPWVDKSRSTTSTSGPHASTPPQALDRSKSKKKRTLDPTIQFGLKSTKAPAEYDPNLEKYVLSLQITSDMPFSAATFKMPDGIFKGRETLLPIPSETSRENSGFPLLDLPAEIRNMVYRHLFIEENDSIYLFGVNKGTRRYSRFCTSEPIYRRRPELPKEAPFTRVAIFSTNRQIYQETAPLFFLLKTFRTSHVRRMTEFLTGLGETVQLVKSLRVESMEYAWLSEFTRTLPRAVGLRSLHLDTYDWASTSDWCFSSDTSGRYSWSRHRPTSASLQDHFWPTFRALHKAQQDAVAVSGLIKWNMDTDPRTHHGQCCDVDGCAKRWIKDFEQQVREKLEVAEANEARKRALIEDGHSDGEDVTEALPPPVRRDTGRPKREAVTKRSIRYSE